MLWPYEAVQAQRDARVRRNGLASGSFAQHAEDVQLMRLLQDVGATGPYLDVGCNHPFKLSTTYLLYLNGWRGICIDPLPRFSPLYRQWRPDDAFEGVAIGEQQGNMALYEFEADVLSTLDPTLAAAYRRQGYRLRRESLVEVRSIDSILEVHSITAPLSLLTIDIEGHELPALRSMNLARWRPLLVCLEALTADGGRNEGAIAHLGEHGYRAEVDLGLNMLFRRVVP